MTQLAKFSGVWITKEGEEIPIHTMTTTHLLNSIHMVERNRMNQLIETHGMGELQANLEYYSQWPESYHDLIKEAKKRKLIGR